jgi:hypothetical protein
LAVYLLFLEFGFHSCDAIALSHTSATCGTSELPTAVSWFRASCPGSPLTTG